MKGKKLEIHFRSFGEFEKDMGRALARHEKRIRPYNHIYFDSVDGFRRFMTIQKLELLTVIANQKPKSIYELAKIVDRDFPAVQKDCVSLAAVGFIKWIERKSGRQQKKPILSFNYSCISIYLPKAGYQIEFSEAA